jgi:hypothetical protein
VASLPHNKQYQHSPAVQLRNFFGEVNRKEGKDKKEEVYKQAGKSLLY